MAAVTATNSDAPDIEAHVLRFSDIDQRESPYRPIDMLLERFERKRFAVVGRPAEQKGVITRPDLVKGRLDRLVIAPIDADGGNQDKEKQQKYYAPGYRVSDGVGRPCLPAPFQFRHRHRPL